MPVPFKMLLPLDESFRELASAAAGKYAELSGGTAADVTALAASVAEQVDRLAHGAEEDAAVELVFGIQSSTIDVTLRCDGRSATVRQPLPAAKT